MSLQAILNQNIQYITDFALFIVACLMLHRAVIVYKKFESSRPEKIERRFFRCHFILLYQNMKYVLIIVLSEILFSIKGVLRISGFFEVHSFDVHHVTCLVCEIVSQFFFYIVLMGSNFGLKEYIGIKKDGMVCENSDKDFSDKKFDAQKSIREAMLHKIDLKW